MTTFSITSVSMSSTTSSSSTSAPTRPAPYKIKKGDTVYKLAKEYGLSVEDFKLLTGLKSNSLAEGDTLTFKSVESFKIKTVTIPDGKGLMYLANANNMDYDAFLKLNGITKDYQAIGGEKFCVISKSNSANNSNSDSSSTGSSTRPAFYKVKDGDTVSKLAKKYGLSIEDFKKWTGLTSDNIKKDSILEFGTATIPKGQGLLGFAKVHNMDYDAFLKLNGISKDYKAQIDEQFYVIRDLKSAGANNSTPVSPSPSNNQASNTTPADNNAVGDKTRVRVNGYYATNWTVETLNDEWERAREKNKRTVKRPKPVTDKKGNIVADVKVLEPTGSGSLNGKTIIINPGHGGAMACTTGKGKYNVNFDPGTSNSKMDGNKETNVFIGNGGKPLEEWHVNQKFSENIAKKIRAAGGKVIWIQGSVYTAQDAIRRAVKEYKPNMLLSLHSNSDGSKRGIYVIANKRGGLDSDDDAFAKRIVNNLNEDSWFKGITEKTSQSLGVLSNSSTTTLPIPAVLIETGNLKNESDIANLNSSAFREKFITKVFEGIVEQSKVK